MNVSTLTVFVVAASVSGCGAFRRIPLASDPMSSRVDRRQAEVKVFDVEWWTPLVKGTLLEIYPIEAASPAVDEVSGRIVVCTRDGFVRALNPTTGKVDWSFATAGRFFAGATVADGVVYVSGGDGVLYALDAADGALKWSYSAGEELVTAPVVASGKVLVHSQNDTLFAIDASTGKWAWQYKRDVPSGFTVRGAARPTVDGARVFSGFADGTLVCVALSDGVMMWEQVLTKSGGLQFLDVDSSPVLNGSGLVFAASFKDGVYALNATTGIPVWRSAQVGVNNLILRGEVLYASGNGDVTALRSLDGKSLWTQGLSGANAKTPTAGRPPTLTESMIVAPTSVALAFINSADGRGKAVWNPGRGVTATPTRVGNHLYVLSNHGTVYAIRLAGGG